MNSQSLALWRKGKPFTFDDPSVGREWTVHPFAYRLKTPEEGGLGEKGIHIDWEHVGWGWHQPSDIMEGKVLGVPRLSDTLRRSYFEADFPHPAGKVLAAQLDKLQNDHESGSRQLTTIALKGFRDFISSMPAPSDLSSWWGTVRLGSWHLAKNGRESMGAAILNALLHILKDVDHTLQQHDKDADKLKDDILAVVDKHIDARYSITERITDHLVEYLLSHSLSGSEKRQSLRVLTLSSSSTIRDSIVDVFAKLDVPTLDLRILESRPLYEGVTLATSVISQFNHRFGSSKDKHLKVSIFTDSTIVPAAEDADVLLIGADRISSANGVSNKIGSLPTALCAKYATNDKICTVVVTDSDKISPTFEGETTNEENDPAEVTASWRDAHLKNFDVLDKSLPGSSAASKADGAGSDQKPLVNVAVRNIYFEWVPLKFINAIVCEEGILGSNTIETLSKNISDNVDKYFAKL